MFSQSDPTTVSVEFTTSAVKLLTWLISSKISSDEGSRDSVHSVLIPALRELREDIQATNKSVKELREEFDGLCADSSIARTAWGHTSDQ